jgi:hypothetical protein
MYSVVTVSIASGWTTEEPEFRSWYCQECSLLRIVQTGLLACLASYPVGTEGSYPGGDAGHSPSPGAEVKET